MATLRVLLIGSAFAVFAVFPQQLQSRLREGRELAVQAVREAQRILMPERWAKVSDTIRQPFRPCEGGPRFMFVGPQ